MNTAQAYDQRLRPTQETGNEKAEPLLSIQQTFIDHSVDLKIDSSRLVMNNGDYSVGFIEDIFTRLTHRLVFEFLGGHARMEDLPCLGDLADGNDEFHRITPSPTFSKSSQFELLDSTGTLHLSSIVFMDSDFNPRIEDYLCESVLLDSFDASSTTFISSLEQFRSKLISQSADHTTEESHQCSPIDSYMIPELCDSEVSATQVFMNCFSSGIDFMSASIPISSTHSEKENSETSVSKMAYPKDGSNIFEITEKLLSKIHNSSVNASNGQIQKTLSHFAPNLYPLMYKNRHGNLQIESCPLTSKNYDVSTRNSNLVNEKNLGNSVSSNYIDQVVQTSNNSTSNWDSVSSMDSSLLRHPCNDTFGDSNKSATISTAESSPTCSIPDPKHLNEFLYRNLKFPIFLASELLDENLDTFDYPSLHEGSDLVDSSDVADQSDNTFNDQSNEGLCSYDKKTLETPGVLIELEDGSSSGGYKEMEVSGTLKISEPCYTGPLDTHWPTGVDPSSFDVTDREEFLDSYGFNNQDEYNDTDYTCEFPIWPGKMDVPWNGMNRMKLTDSASTEDPLSSFHDENSKNSVSSTHLDQRKCAFNTSSLDDITENDLSQGHPFNDGFQNFIEAPILGTTENILVYAIPDPATLNEYLYGTLKSPMFLASERMNTNFDRHDSPSFYGDCYSGHCADVANLSDNCNLELLDSDCSSKDPISFPFEFSDHYELLESYGLNEQDQYTDDFICESPTWPGKV